MYPPDAMSRYCRVALYAQRGSGDCDRPSAHRRAGVSHAERSRQLRMLRSRHRSALGPSGLTPHAARSEETL